ncbi:MAG: hypothetical protein MI861_02385, partial [Pirellulales bacterium]|nr:hypothetical protein [Pirellulales bacterium]
MPGKHSIRYRVDLLILAMFSAAALDMGTTYYFVSQHLGTEANPVLGPLVRHSTLWIPLYLAVPTVFIPTMPEVCRQSFAAGHAATSFLAGSNNLSGILTGNYFWVDRFGFQSLLLVGLCCGVVTFLGMLAATRAGSRVIGRALLHVV